MAIEFPVMTVIMMGVIIMIGRYLMMGNYSSVDSTNTVMIRVWGVLTTVFIDIVKNRESTQNSMAI